MGVAEQGPESQRERDLMVDEQLVRRGVRAPAVLAALRRIPRELFVGGSAGSAYADSALPIECGQTISQPYMVGRMTELLELGPQAEVLEIGTGSGYQTAVLASIGRQVYTVEWYGKLMTLAAERLARLGLRNVTLRCGDGSLGWPEHAPYEAIIVTAGGPDVPEPLVQQLAEGGRLVAPIGPESDQDLVRVVMTPQGPQREYVLKCRFVRLLGQAGWRAE